MMKKLMLRAFGTGRSKKSMQKLGTPVIEKPIPVTSTTKFLLFDFGSVLRVRTTERVQTIQSLAEQLKERVGDIDLDFPAEDKALGKLIKGKMWKKKVGIGAIERREAYLQGFEELGIKYDTKQNQAFIDSMIERYDFENKVVLKEMMVLLQKLKGKSDVVLGVISNHSLSLRQWLTERYNLIPDIFDNDLVVISAEEQVKKPNEQIFKAMLARLQTHCTGFNVEEHVKNMFFIDNKEDNCSAARTLGITSFCYEHNIQNPSLSLQELEKEINTFLEQ